MICTGSSFFCLSSTTCSRSSLLSFKLFLHFCQPFFAKFFLYFSFFSKCLNFTLLNILSSGHPCSSQHSNKNQYYSNISKQSMVAHLDMICFYRLSVLCVSHDRN
jgi:hypothetical protein